jgi:NAD-dependent SIR2 family protein deacetylase
VYVCDECEAKLKKMQCVCCNEEYYYSVRDYRLNEKIRDMVRLNLCRKCYKEKLEVLWNEAFKNKRQPHLPFDVLDIYLIEP